MASADERLEQLERSVAQLAETALLGAGATFVRADPHLVDLVNERRAREREAEQRLLEEQRRQAK